MNRWTLLALTAFSLSAVAEEAIYIPGVPRSEDPFVFCTEGPYRDGLVYEQLQHCWKPTSNDPESATLEYTCTEYCNASGCPPMNMVSAAQWGAMCRKGGGKGSDWIGATPANMTPFWH